MKKNIIFFFILLLPPPQAFLRLSSVERSEKPERWRQARSPGPTLISLLLITNILPKVIVSNWGWGRFCLLYLVGLNLGVGRGSMGLAVLDYMGRLCPLSYFFIGSTSTPQGSSHKMQTKSLLYSYNFFLFYFNRPFCQLLLHSIHVKPQILSQICWIPRGGSSEDLHLLLKGE